MAGPWEKFKTEPTAATKPWERYKAPSENAPPSDDRSTLDKLVDFTANAFAKPAEKVISTVTEPMQVYDQMAAAPVRAGVGAIQRGGDLGDAGNAALEQLKAGTPLIGTGGPGGMVLDSTPTGQDIAFQGMTDNGIRPEYAASMAPMAGMMAEAALDIGNIPTSAMMRGAGAAVKAGAAAAEETAAKAIARTGERVTGGALDADKAIRMYKELSAKEMINPGTFKYGQLGDQTKLLGEMREAFRTNRVNLPGSHDVAMDIQRLLQEGEYRARRTPGSERVLQMIQDRAFEKQIVQDPPVISKVDDGFGNMADVVVQPSQFREVTVPKDLTLDEMDDIIRAMDDVSYTGIGNERAKIPNWSTYVQKSRRLADEALQTVPEGQLFKSAKSREEGLITAGKERSKLVEAAADAGAMAALATKNPVALVMQGLTPKAFVGMMGALKVPSEVAQGLYFAHSTGRLSVIRDAVEKIAEKFPDVAERVVRGSVLMSGKPAGQQFLTPDEAGSLDKIRVFDPNAIAEEKARIQNDPTLSSTEQAKQISSINKNGYITYDGPKAPPQKTAIQSPLGDKDSKTRFFDALKRSQGH